jgi:hypothetical protein
VEDYWFLLLEMLRKEQEDNQQENRLRLEIEPPMKKDIEDKAKQEKEQKRVIILDI